ncbi:unnamed protein product [Didymodactylos carnosus]|uniref:Uncharacterized protein n=1 Tax=Didymodactylos carnosus TaxID=1234261 RepID=A0A813YFR5_9BILA|nr:unnamed protein product [Didymodactylos carnosus]CAF1233376.1 unnamed protein product [Didymodactylos carnosus]CAF3669400.1 unnamed protein product [Didymodactylos carnosus]CAF4041532.1 unnamed protein product [Didymodactylos carnosus]
MSLPRGPYTGVGYRPPYAAVRRPPTFYGRPPYAVRPIGPAPGGAGAGTGAIAGVIGGLAAPLLCLGCLSSLALLGLFATMIAAATYMNKIQKEFRRGVTGAGSLIEMMMHIGVRYIMRPTYGPRPIYGAPRPIYGTPLPPPARGGGGAGGAGALGGVLGGLGGAVTCLCCLSALGLIGLWATFIPFVAYFKYAYDQWTRTYGVSSATNFGIQQVVLLVSLCFVATSFLKRRIPT